MFAKRNTLKQPPPVVSEVHLQRTYRFMYESLVVATPSDLYLFLEKTETVIHALRFRYLLFRQGYPNDEVRGSHPLSQFGLGLYGLFKVESSPLVRQLMEANRIHPNHTDAMFEGDQHFVACFKDVTLEVVCSRMDEIALSEVEVGALISRELANLAE